MTPTWLLILITNYTVFVNVVQQPDQATCFAQAQQYLGQSPFAVAATPGSISNPPVKYIVAYCVQGFGTTQP